MLVSMREFARRNGVSAVAISKAVKAGRLPAVDGKIDPEQAQPVWDQLRRVKRPEGVNLPVNQGVNRAPQVNTRPADPAVNLGRQVRAVDDRGPRVAVTVPINGAEELVLAKAASDLGVTMQSFILSRCGVQLWRLGAPARVTHRQPVRKALERRSVTIFFGRDDHATLQTQARAAGLSLPQYIRTRCDFPVRQTSMPGTDERVREEDDAWEILKRLGLDPEPYFED